MPAGRSRASLVLDPVRNRNMLFGGYSGSGAYLGDTWTYDGTRWTSTNVAGPSVRNGAQTAFDSATGTTILFGGYNGSTALGDTWSWNGSAWTQLSPAVSPPARSQGVMAYSAALGKLVLFGGIGGGYLADTWTFDGTTWTNVTAAGGPSTRYDASMAYDASSGKVVLYGGGGPGTGVFYGDTWTYGTTGWVQASPAHAPSARNGSSLSFDPVLQRVVLFGGFDANYTYSDTWMFDGTDWELASGVVGPVYRALGAMAAAAGNGQLLLVGGYSGGGGGSTITDSWTYDWQKLGTPSGATLESRSVSDRSTYGVDVANGNLTVNAKDLHVAGVGEPFDLTRVYNGLAPSNSPELGNGWSFTTGDDLYLSGLPDGSAALYGLVGDAGQTYFHRNADNTFTSPPGVAATLTAGGGTGITSTLTVNSSGETFKFGTPVSTGLLASRGDRNGNTISFTYNSTQQLTGVTDTQGRTGYTFAYTTAGYLASVTDPTNRQVTYTQDANGYLTSVTDAAGGITYYGYGNDGGLVQIFPPGCGSGCATNFTDNGLHQTTQVTQPSSGLSITYAYTPPDPRTANSWQQSTSTDANAHKTTYESSYAIPVVKTTDAAGHVRPASYNPNNQVTMAADAMGVGNNPGNQTTYTYNNGYDPTSAALPTGATSFTGYNNGDKLNGSGTMTCPTNDTTHPHQPKCAADAQGNMSTFTYDGPGNQTATNSPGGVNATATYNPPAGQTPTCGGKPGQVCTITDGNGHINQSTYDAAGNLVAVTPPAPLGATTRTYDGLGRVATSTDGKGQTTTYGYDLNDRLISATLSGSTSCAAAPTGCVTYTYDPTGNLTRQADIAGHATTYTYDAAHTHQTGITTPDGASSTITLDGVGNTTRATDTTGMTSYTYDATNNVISVAEPGGNCPTTGAGTACTHFGYDANSVRTSTTYPGGVVQATTVDKDGRTTRILAQKPGGPVLSDLSYGYTNGGDRTVLQTKTTTVNPAAGAAPNGSVTTYGYDGFSRLLTATEKTSTGGTNAKWSYSYDKVGNRLTQAVTAPGGAVTTTTDTYNAANELTTINGAGTGISFDTVGNQTSFPAVGGTALQAATPSRTTTYSATNQPVTTAVGGAAATTQTYIGVSTNLRSATGTTTFQNGLLGVTNQQTGSATTSFTRTPDGSLVSERLPGGSNYYLTDSQGSVIGLVDTTGALVAAYAYDPYGQTRAAIGGAAAGNPYRYTGQYRDIDTGLYKLGVRFYDSSQGRFTQQDPSGKEANSYSYTRDNPVDYADPQGTERINIDYNTALRIGFAIAVGGGVLELAGVLSDATVVGLPDGAAFAVAGFLLLTLGGYIELQAFSMPPQCPYINYHRVFGVVIFTSAGFQDC